MTAKSVWLRPQPDPLATPWHDRHAVQTRLAVRVALGVSAIDTPAAQTKLGIEEIAKIAGNCAKDWPPSFSSRVLQ
jgi:hypothetical protein